MANTPSINLGDIYKQSGLSTAPDLIRLRQAPAEKLLKELKHAVATDLVRLYYGLPLPGGSEWFRDAFRETDTSFSMIDNAREAAVLAAGIFSASLKTGNGLNALTLVTASVTDHRRPTVYPTLVEEARDVLAKEAVSFRSQTAVNLKSIKLPADSKVPAAAVAFAQGPDWAKTAELLKLVGEEAHGNTKTAINQIFNVLSPLAAEVVVLREQTEMLWWYIAGYSRALDKPFSELPIGLTAMMAGIDVADLSKSLAGPVAAPAIMHKLLDQGRKGKTTQLTVDSAVNEYPIDSFSKLDLKESLKNLPDICPVLTALSKALEIGASPAWHSSYRKLSGISPDATFLPTQFAMQVFRERSLLKALD